jgi:hypothetical protein
VREVEPLPRIKMELLLDELAGRADRSEFDAARRVLPADEQGLAGLILEAYRDTADDEGATFEDALKEVTFLARDKRCDLR